MSEIIPVLKELIAEAEAGRPCALCAVLKTRGSTPQSSGAALLIKHDRSTVGTLGGGCVEAEVVRRSHKEALPSGQSAVMDFVLNHNWGWDDGLICGGRMDIGVMPISSDTDLAPFRKAIDDALQFKPASVPLNIMHQGKRLEYRLNLEAPPPLIIAGAGHVGHALANLALDLDYRVVVIDDRAEYASPDRFKPGVELIVDNISKSLEEFPITPDCYVVIVTRGHKHDQRSLEAVIDSPSKYIGMIGSKRKIRLIFDDMIKRGFSQDRLDTVHTPIGLSIGAVTVNEIAVSIAAELIRVRRQEVHKIVEGPFEESPSQTAGNTAESKP